MVSQTVLDYRWIGQRIREIRQQRGLTQQQLALGICNQSQISRIEKGVESVSAEILFQIAHKFSLDIRIFFDMTEQQINEIQSIRKNIRYLQKKHMYQELLQYIEDHQVEAICRYSLMDQQFVLYHKGNAYVHLGAVDRGFPMIQLALKLTYHCERIPALYEIEVIQALAIAYGFDGDYRACIGWLHKCLRALHVYREGSDQFTPIFYYLSKAYSDTQDYRMAIEYATQGIRYCENHKIGYYLDQLYYECGYSYEQIGQQFKAEQCYTKFQLLQDLFCTY